MILLDESFAGVDTANRAQLFGTFSDWDLDAVFTSDHERCQYATLDGIAVHHLHPAVGDEPVTLRGLSLSERQALADLLGADRLPGAAIRLTVARLAIVLGVNGPDGVRDLIEGLRGPLQDRRITPGPPGEQG